MEKISLWFRKEDKFERSPLVAKEEARLGLAVCGPLAKAAVALFAFVFLLRFIGPTSSSSPFEPSLRHHRWDDLGSKFVNLDLSECSIPQVQSRNWSAWLRNYTPPACPAGKKSWRAPLNKDEIITRPNSVQFSIQSLPKTVPATPSEPSIAIVFLDAVSRASFFRSFPRSAAEVQARMRNDDAFTFGGLAASDRYTPPNAAMVLAGITCSDGVVSGAVYQSFCESLAQSAPGDVAMWEIAKRHGMVTSAAVPDWGELDFLHRGSWDHEFEAKNVTSLEHHETDFGYLTCLNGQEVSGAQLEHTRSVHKAYDQSGSRVLSFTYLSSMHQPDTRVGRVVDDQLLKTLETFSELKTPTAVLFFADHGSQYAKEEDQQAERYLPLGIFLPPRGAPASWLQNLKSNQFAITSMADLHTTLLHRIDPEAKPLHASWPYKGMLMWPIQAVDLATDEVTSRSPAALGIQERHHPCASPWIRGNASALGSHDLDSAANYLVQQVNELAGIGRLTPGPCRPVRLMGISAGEIYTREPFQVKMTISVQTLPRPGFPEHNATFTGTVHRSWGFCHGYMQSACLIGGFFPWQLDELEPISVYSKYEGCMGAAAKSWRKRFCICDS